MESLKDKVIILTGASRGIGRAFAAINLSEDNPKLVLVSRKRNDLDWEVLPFLKCDEGNVLLVGG